MKKLFEKQSHGAEVSLARAALAREIATRSQQEQDIRDAAAAIEVARQRMYDARRALSAAEEYQRTGGLPDDFAEQIIHSVVDGKEITLPARGASIDDLSHALDHWKRALNLCQDAHTQKMGAIRFADDKVKKAADAVVIDEFPEGLVVQRLTVLQEEIVSLRTAYMMAVQAGFIPASAGETLMKLQVLPTAELVQGQYGKQPQITFLPGNSWYQAWLDALSSLTHDASAPLPKIGELA